MDQLLVEHPFLSLFFLGFLASTLLPLGSEWLLAILISQGHSPSLVVLVATMGNFLGACTTYFVGHWGSHFFVSRVLRISPSESTRAKRMYQKWGLWTLFFSWIPVVGDPLCLAAGMFRTPFHLFLFPVITGKFLRYGVVAWIALQYFPG